MNLWVRRSWRLPIRFLLLSWILLISYLLLSPSDNLTVPWYLDWPGSDKAVHLTIFMISAALTHLSYSSLSFWWVVLVYAAYGLGVELLQIKIPGRSFEFLDLVSDVMGTMIGSLAFTYFNRR